MSNFIGEPQHYPVPMERYGLNPYGKNLYRVVFAPSVRHLVGGRWKDGCVEYRSRPSYSHIGNEWILERWFTGDEFCSMSREAYEIRLRNETGLFTMGPYPSEGTYVMCLDSPLLPAAIQSVGKLIEGIEFGRKNKSHEREVQNRLLLEADIAKREQAADDVMLDKIREKRPAFGNRPTSFAGGVHSTKTKADFKITAPFGRGIRVLKEKANA